MLAAVLKQCIIHFVRVHDHSWGLVNVRLFGDVRQSSCRFGFGVLSEGIITAFVLLGANEVCKCFTVLFLVGSSGSIKGCFQMMSA